jgi:hypothetical protein
MRTQLSDLQKQLKSKGTTPQDENQAIREELLKDPSYKAAYDADVEALGEDIANARLGRDIVMEKRNRAGKQEIDAKFESDRLERLNHTLIERHPELTNPDFRKRYDALVQEAQKREGDDMFWLSLIVKAAKGAMLPQLVDEGISRKLSQMGVDEINKRVAESLTAGTAGAPGAAGGVAQGQNRTDGRVSNKEFDDIFFA